MPKPSNLITGCSEGGVGHSLALAFARKNYKVFATARKIFITTSMANSPSIALLELDVNSPSSIQAAFHYVAEATDSKLDILYHNAGARSITMAIHSDWASAEWFFGTNFFAVVVLTRVFMTFIVNAGPGSKIAFSNSISSDADIKFPSNLKQYLKILRSFKYGIAQIWKKRRELKDMVRDIQIKRSRYSLKQLRQYEAESPVLESERMADTPAKPNVGSAAQVHGDDTSEGYETALEEWEVESYHHTKDER